MDLYQKIDKVGKGTYGVVYKAQNRRNNAIVALKRIKLNNEKEGLPRTAVREISILKDLYHPNIVRLLDVLHSDKKLTLVFEFIETDLKKHLDSCGGDLDKRMVKVLLSQLLRGISFCHEHKVLHRDLKPQNLLISKKGELKIADFGLGRAFGIPLRKYSVDVVTLWYRSPDVLLGSGHYGTSIDIWSVGCIFAEMTTGRPLFPGNCANTQLHLIFTLLGYPNEEKWPDLAEYPEWPSFKHTVFSPVLPKAKVNYSTPREQINALFPKLDGQGIDLLVAFLEYSPNTRITAIDALNHEFLDDVRTKA